MLIAIEGCLRAMFQHSEQHISDFQAIKYSSNLDWDDISQVDAERNAQTSTGLFTLMFISCRDFSSRPLHTIISVRSSLTDRLKHFLTLNRSIHAVVFKHYDRNRGARARGVKESSSAATVLQCRDSPESHITKLSVLTLHQAEAPLLINT